MNVDYDSYQAALDMAINPSSTVSLAQFFFHDNNEYTVIPDKMFADTAISEINFPRGITTICEGAFSGCTALTSYYPSISFDEYGNYKNNVTNYRDYCFSGCTSLEELHFSNLTSKLSIGVGSFSNCNSLTYVTFPSNYEIGASAFTNCSSLTGFSREGKLIIPNSCFSYCTSLTATTFLLWQAPFL